MNDDQPGGTFPCHRQPIERDEWRASLLALQDRVQAKERRCGTVTIAAGAAAGSLFGFAAAAVQGVPGWAVFTAAVLAGIGVGAAVAGLLRVDREQAARIRAIVAMDQAVTGGGHDSPSVQDALTEMARRALADEELLAGMGRGTARRMRVRVHR